MLPLPLVIAALTGRYEVRRVVVVRVVIEMIRVQLRRGRLGLGTPGEGLSAVMTRVRALPDLFPQDDPVGGR